MKAVISDEAPSKIVPDKKYPGMYRLQWKDRSQSVKYNHPNGPLDDGDPIGSYGMYNLTRAKDILRHYTEYINSMKQSEALKGNSLATRSKMITDEFLVVGC